MSSDGHFLIQPNGEPFFWLGDTAWELFHRLTREEVETYLQDRSRKGFNVIQAVATGKLDFDGLKRPNRYGAAPFVDMNPARPNQKYFEHVDWVIERAARHGIRVALLPMWSRMFVSDGRQVFNVTNAESYGRWLGNRYRGKGVIWVLGGDVNPVWYSRVSNSKEPRERTIVDYRSIYDAMAKGIAAGDGGDPCITYHPSPFIPLGAAKPRMSLYFGDRAWFDMSMLQSGHSRLPSGDDDGGGYLNGGFSFMWNATFNYLPISEEFTAVPARPIIDGEPRFEDHPNGEAHGFWRAHDVRNAIYHALFAGAAGHTYGNFSIFDFHDPTHAHVPKGFYDEALEKYTRMPWQEALDAPGAGQMQYAKALLLSRPYFTRIPDQSLIVGAWGEGEAHIGATRDRTGAYVMVYLPQGQPVTVDLNKLSGASAVAWWFDPRSGKATRIEGAYPTNQAPRFTPPTSGPEQDWVLVIDDASKGFEPPGSAEP